MKFLITNDFAENIPIKNDKLYYYKIFNQSQCNIKTSFKMPPLYTVIIYDVSSSSPDYIHLLIVNNNETILKYEPPNPPAKSGEHKYHACIYKQQSRIKYVSNIRSHFNTSEFFYNNNLKVLDCMMFRVVHP